MKTGGTMNFLKKAGAILMLVAVFASSCNKYADDFKQLNTKLDALATQVAGVTTLTTDMTALKASVASIQTAIAALPKTSDITALSTSLTAISGKIDGITASLKTLSDNAATKADLSAASLNIIAGVKAELTAQLKVTNDAIAAAQVALKADNTAQTAALQAAIIANNTAQAAAIQTQLDAMQKAIVGDPASTDAAALTIKGLQLQLAIEQKKLDDLLANSNMFTGPVNITTDAEVDFYLPKIGSWTKGGMINGTLNINTASITKLADLKTITNNIVAVIGGAASNVTITAKAGDALSFAKLGIVTGSYSVAGYDVDDSTLASVGGNVVLNYDGPYASTALTTVGGDLALVNKAAVAPAVGTTSVSFPNVKVAGLVGDVALLPATGIVSFPLATSVELAGSVSSLTAAVATTVKIGTAAYPAAGLTILAVKATTVDLASAATSAGAITITADPTATVKLDNFNSPVAVTINAVKTVSIPKWVAGTLTAPAAETVTLAKHEYVIPAVLPAVKTLTLGNINAAVALGLYPTLVSADVTGKAQTTWVATAGTTVSTVGNAALTTLKLGGNIATATVSGNALLTSVTTTGSVNSLTVNACAILASLNLGHTYFIPTNAANGGPGSDLIVTANPKLTSVKSSGDYPRLITITGNILLTSIDLTSYVTPLLAAPGATTFVTINANKLSGDYTNAVAITPTTPYAETIIKQADFAKLKPFVAKYPAVGPPFITLAMDADLVTLGGVAGNALLSARMLADAAHLPAFVAPATGVGSPKELLLVQ